MILFIENLIAYISFHVTTKIDNSWKEYGNLWHKIPSGQRKTSDGQFEIIQCSHSSNWAIHTHSDGVSWWDKRIIIYISYFLIWLGDREEIRYSQIENLDFAWSNTLVEFMCTGRLKFLEALLEEIVGVVIWFFLTMAISRAIMSQVNTTPNTNRYGIEIMITNRWLAKMKNGA